jgi:protein involved in polysaccharide export with SLBB domain
MAGGFTREASLTIAELVRLSLGPGGVALERMESHRGGIGSEDSSYYNLETDLRLEKEIVNVDFERLFLQGDSSQDVTLQDGDVVQIPGGKGTLYVFGQVVSPGHIPFVAGRSVDYYIEKAGGYTDRARKGDVKIVKGKSKQWLKMGETEPEPGDYIWVPQEIERTFAYYMTIFGQTASILSVAASIIILAVQLNK